MENIKREPLIVKEYLETPVLMVTFRRYELTKKIFEEVKKVKPKKLFILSDGPRENSKDDAIEINKVRGIFQNIDWDCEVKTLFREKNLGLKENLVSGINWFFENVEEGIIIEDDVFPSQSFFWFCQQMLEKYRNDTRIMHITGYKLKESDGKEKVSTYFFTQFPNVWGWATWRRAWKLNNPDMVGFEKFREQKQVRNIFNGRNMQKYYDKLFQEVHAGKIVTWDYQWFYSVFTNHGLVVRPYECLTQNLGFAEDNATNTSVKMDTSQDMNEISEIVHPDFVIPVLRDKDDDKAHFSLVYGPLINFIKKRPFFLFRKDFYKLVKFYKELA